MRSTRLNGDPFDAPLATGDAPPVLPTADED
jgi:hypothetical protein